MKTKSVLFICLAFLSKEAFNQTNTFPSIGSAGIGTTTPVASSALEIKSTTQGLLIPRMTRTQRDAIISPATGLMIFQTNSTPGFYYFDGSKWAAFTAKGANLTLSNLSAITAINSDLLPDTNNTVNLGSPVSGWKDVYMDGSIYNNGSRFISGDVSNTWIGSKSGLSNDGGLDNTGIGLNSLRFNTSGAGNTATGSGALLTNVSGHFNTANGYSALSNNLTGNGNIGIGYTALLNNRTGSFNCANGNGALLSHRSGNYNAATGLSALLQDTSGSGNVADGAFALRSNIDGSYNTGIGDHSDVGSESLTNSTAIGANAFVSASNALVLGSIAGINNATTSVNVGIGTSSPVSSLHIKAKGSTSVTSSFQIEDSSSTATILMATDDGKIGIGTASPSQKFCVLDGSNSGGTPNDNATIVMEKNSTSYFQILTPNGYENGILFGVASNSASGGIIYNAGTTRKGFELRTGANNTRIRIDSLGQIALGNFAPAHRLQLNVDDASKPATSTWTIASDERLKTNISEFKDGLDLVKKIRPVWFEYNGKAGLPKGMKSVGILAQEMQKIAPYMIGKYKSTDEQGNINEYLDYNANALFYILVNSVKELSKQNDTQQKVNADLQRQIDELRMLLNAKNSTTNTGINSESQTIDLGTSLKLEQNAPNPFNASTTIKYFLPANNGNVYMNFYDEGGKLLKSVKLNGRGDGSITVNARDLASGAYRYALISDGKVIDSKQMIAGK